MKRETYQEVVSSRTHGRDDVDLLHEKEVDDNLGTSIQYDARVDRDCTRDDIKIVGLDQHGRH